MSLNKECTIDPLLIAEFDKLFKDKTLGANNSKEAKKIALLWCTGDGAIRHDNEVCLNEVIALLNAF